jgi:NAD(P)H dehydrogenase (quinone)
MENLKIAVIINQPDSEAYRLGCFVAEGMWDAGAEVRVRRAVLPEIGTPAGSERDWTELLDELDDVPEAAVEDIGWADVIFFPGGTLSLDTAHQPRPIPSLASAG